MKVVIIGGVAGGATAAARIRRLDESIKLNEIEPNTAKADNAKSNIPTSLIRNSIGFIEVSKQGIYD